jgi:nucleotide-binding universal stress UspA family protein
VALRDKSRVLAMYVIEVPMTLPLNANMPAEKEKGEKALDQAEMIGKEYGINVDTKLVQARSAGTAIVEEAAKRKADLIMLGHAGKTKIEEMMGGKTANYVAKNAPCRVVMSIGEKV